VQARKLVVDLQARAPAWRITTSARKAISEAAPDGWQVHFVEAETVSDGDGGAQPAPEVVSAISDAEAYFGFGMSEALFTAAPRLKWIHSAAAGVGSLLFPAIRDGDVLLSNSAGVYAIPMAEHVVGGILHFVRGFDMAIERREAGVWDKEPFVGATSPVRELGRMRALIIGAGGIGSEIAKRLTPFGTECVGVRRRPEAGIPEGFSRVCAPDAIDAELPAADVVVLSAPATPSTRHILSRERLSLLPAGAVVVNIGRGSLLDEAALLDALRAGSLRGAVLDVTEREPLAAESPLWQLRSVLLTPHVAGVSPGVFWERAGSLFIDNWRRYARGDRLRNLVDKQAGY
jgi:phosphoglycerate dehydrogenase-like enzyme